MRELRSTSWGVDLCNPVADHPLNVGRVGWWLNLPETSGGPNWSDLTGRVPAALNGNARGATSRPAATGEIRFATETAIDISGIAARGTPAHVVIAAWVYRTNPGTLVTFGGSSYQLPSLVLDFGFYSTAGQLSLYGPTDDFRSMGAVPDFSWHHVLVVLDGPRQVATAYLDGGFLGSLSYPKAVDFSASAANNTLGRQVGPYAPLYGMIDDAAIWGNNPLAIAAPDRFARAVYAESLAGHPETINRVQPSIAAFSTPGAGPQIVAPGSITGSATLGQPAAQPGAAVAQPGTIPPGSAVGSPAASAGSATVQPSPIAPGSSVGNPSAQASPAVVRPTSIGPGSTVGAPAVTPGPASVVPASIAPGSSIGTPSASGEADPATPLLFEVELETWLRATLGRPAWPGMIPQGKAGTCLVYTLVDSNSELNLDGPDGLREWHLQFDAWGKTRLEAIALIERLRLALEGYTGPMGRAVVENATLETEGDDFAPPINASDRPAHRRRAEYSIFFRDGLSS